MTRLFLILLVLFTACRGAESTATPMYLDVRTPEEFVQGHVAGALNIPVEQLEQRWTELAAQKDARIVVYCRSGRRSAVALQVLKKNGFTHVEDGGALSQLTAAGVPVE